MQTKHFLCRYNSRHINWCSLVASYIWDYLKEKRFLLRGNVIPCYIVGANLSTETKEKFVFTKICKKKVSWTNPLWGIEARCLCSWDKDNDDLVKSIKTLYQIPRHWLTQYLGLLVLCIWLWKILLKQVILVNSQQEQQRTTYTTKAISIPMVMFLDSAQILKTAVFTTHALLFLTTRSQK